MLSLKRPTPAAEVLSVELERVTTLGVDVQPIVRPAERPAALRSWMKRAFDVSVAVALLIVATPVLLIAAALIKLTSQGPVLFRQERIGADRRPFTVLKLRTMVNGVSDEVHRRYVEDMIDSKITSKDAAGVFKLNGDKRVTSVGRWLRKTSIDELPQLINVLRGEMSLIGPRPPLAYEVDKYEPWQLERLSVRPGITGLWQVSGRNRLSYTEMCAIDIAYIRTWSFRRDLAIAFRTPWAMFVDGGGAS